MIEAAIRGRLGADPVERTTSGGKTMVTVNVAVSVNRYGAEDDTQWFGLAAFGKTADVLARHAKGDLVNAFGKITRSRYTGKDGSPRESWQMTVDQVISARTVRPAGKKKRESGDGAPSRASDGGASGFDDEIPF